MNRKANLNDFLTAGFIFLGLAIVGFVCFIILDGFADGFGGKAEYASYVPFVSTSNTKIATSLDWGILFFAVLSIVFSYIAAKKIPTDPKWISIVLLFIFVFFIAAFIISNVFAGFMKNGTFANFINVNMPITFILLRYFPFYGLIYDFIVLIGFFGKKESSL
jgi:hypothetical protein